MESICAIEFKAETRSATFPSSPRRLAPLIGGLLCAVGVVFAYLGACQAAEPNNIIIFMADDLDWNDLPFFSPPLDETAYGNLEKSYVDQDISPRRGELTLIEPAANRFAARMFAERTSGNFGVFRTQLGDNRELSYTVRAFDRPIGDQTPYVPSSPACTNQKALCSVCGNSCTDCCAAGDPSCDCEAKTDVLAGFGGLARLMNEGVSFPRFYANSAKCAPSRAALMSGRYPRRTGVTNNGASLRADEVTIAEFLKQGCNNPVDFSHQCFDGENFAQCGCYMDSATCTGLPCYRTGLVGKWHLGADNNSPWAQGFDEYFGFGGGARDYWNTRPLQCGPSPKFCNDKDVNGQTINVSSILCETDPDCRPPQTSLSSLAECVERGSYIGTRQSFNDCTTEGGETSAAVNNTTCCEPNGGRDKFVIRKKIYNPKPDPGDPELEVHKAKGRDSRGKNRWPCNDDGLTHQTHCAYLTRLLRDQARNFIVRNSDRQPYLLIVTFHATHVAHHAPIRTEDHYRTEDSVEHDTFKRPRAPSSGSKKWGELEEVDAAIGEVLDVLDKTGVCELDPRVDCTGDGDCSSLSLGTCIPIGRCEGTTTACSADNAATGCTCETPVKNTYVFFTGDQGSPNKRPDGAPGLRGHKGNVFEAGVRVGLLARGPTNAYRCVDNVTRDVVGNIVCDPGNSNCQQGQTCLWRGGVSSQASILDFLATAADLAGYGLDDNGRILGFSSPAGVVDSVSFAAEVDDPSMAPSWRREFNYASFPGAGATIVSREDHFASNSSAAQGVCAFDALGDDGSLFASGPHRRLRGGACAICDPMQQPSISCPAQWCRLEAKVCANPVDINSAPGLCDQQGSTDPCEAYRCDPVTGSSSSIGKDYCANFTPLVSNCCEPTVDSSCSNPCTADYAERAAYRCEQKSDCPGTLSCVTNVWVPCNRCERATWKLKTAPSGTETALFDLSSNPGEEQRLNFLYKQCNDETKPAQDVARIVSVLDELKDGTNNTGVANWLTCVADTGSTGCMTAY